jgi:prephenate dehydratase
MCAIEGFVGETHKLVLAPQDPGWHVIAEVTLSISNNLLVKPGTRPSDLRKIISHPEALRESANWLKANFPQLPQEGVNSTAAAAEAVAKGDGTIAAIASAAAASVYQLTKGIIPGYPGRSRQCHDVSHRASRGTRVPGAASQSTHCEA